MGALQGPLCACLMSQEAAVDFVPQLVPLGQKLSRGWDTCDESPWDRQAQQLH